MRKQITYAHKRNRNRTCVPQEYNSSPLEDLSDPEQYLTRPEMSRRIIKRSGRSGSGSISLDLSKDHGQGHSYKKRRTSPREEHQQAKSLVLPLNDNHNLQTPHPTQLTEDQVFRLESSRGLPLSPNHEFSPVPTAPPQRSFSPALRKPTRIIHKAKTPGNNDLSCRTSSRSLKENISSKSAPKSATSTTGNSSRRITRSRSKTRLHLASPFTSQPSSPNANPSHNPRQSITKPAKITKITTTTAIGNPKRTLSDRHYNPNLPQAQSTANSPTQPPREEVLKNRRPSAPSATSYRPDVASWFVSRSNQVGDVRADSSFDAVRSPTVFNLGRGCGLSVDFNRPPSQLSFNSAYDENFFGDAQGASTPFGLNSRKQVQSYEYVDLIESSSSEDEDEDQYLNHHVPYLSRSHPDINTQRNKAALAYAARAESTWVTDSLISPPTAPRAYSRSRSLDHDKNGTFDVHMQSDDDEDDTTLGLGPGLGLDAAPRFEDVLLRCDGANTTTRTGTLEEKAETLKELFEDLEIAYGDSRPTFTRSRSLDLDSMMPPPPKSPSPTQDEGGTQVQALESPAYISPSKAKHNNIKVRGTRDRRGTIRASDFPSIPARDGGMGVAGGARRTRSGTIVGPARNSRERSGTVVASTCPMGLPAIPSVIGNDVDTGKTDVDIRSPPDDADVQMFDCGGPSLRIDNVQRSEEDDDNEGDPMNIVGPWRDEEWPWAVAEPPSPLRPRQTRTEKRKRGQGLGLALGLPKGWELWQMKEHDEDDGEVDPLDLLR